MITYRQQQPKQKQRSWAARAVVTATLVSASFMTVTDTGAQSAPMAQPLGVTIEHEGGHGIQLASSVGPGAWQGKMPFFGWPDAVGNARDALTLLYIDRRIYNPARCEPKLVEGYVFIRCAPSLGGVPGGIFVVTDAFDEVAIIPVNGKAMSHSDGLRQLRDASLASIPVLRRDIPEVMAIIRAAPLSEAIEAFGR